MISFLPLLLTLLVCSSNGKDVLRQVHVIARHGSRSSLSKASISMEEGDQSVLTSNGQRQLYELGQWLRQRYANEGLIDEYDPRKVRIESSNFDRTLVSASSLALGLFPRDARSFDGTIMIPETPANIPVYTHGNNANDVTIRAYDKCYAFSQNLERLYGSNEWLNHEIRFIQMLVKFADIRPFRKWAVPLNSKYGADSPVYQHIPPSAQNYIPLEEMWNVYDFINIHKVECDPQSGASDTAPDFMCNSGDMRIVQQIDDVEWSLIQEMVSISEISKYGKNDTAAGNLIGSNLVREILDRILGDSGSGGSYTDYREGESAETEIDQGFFVYSAHFPTILGVYSALDKMLDEPYQLDNEVIPGYGAALMFESYQDDETNERNIQIYYKPSELQRPVPVRLTSGKCFNKISCSLEHFQEAVGELLIQSQESWCLLCANREADVCLKYVSDLREKEHETYGNIKSDFSNLNSCNSQNYGTAMLLVGLGGLAAGSLITVFFVVLVMRGKKNEMKHKLEELEVPPPIEEGDDAEVGVPESLVDVQLNGEKRGGIGELKLETEDNGNNTASSSASSSPSMPSNGDFLPKVPEIS